MFTKFTIYGERCSGTNFLRKVIVDNFNLELTHLPNVDYAWKHFFGHEKNQAAIQSSTDVVILSIVRNPIDYFVSFFKSPHHQSSERIVDFETFLTSEFYSINKEGELLTDRYFEQNCRRYKNIFEMRAVKNRFLALTIPKLTANCYLVQYERLKNDSEAVLVEISAKFRLTPKQQPFIIERRRVAPRGTSWDVFDIVDSPIGENYVVESPKCKEIILSNLDFSAERIVGYIRESIVSRLI
jgi:hypothetical protein